MRDSCKPAPKTDAPWGSFNVPSQQQSTASAAFVNFGPPRMREPVKPTNNDVISLHSRFEGRSTAQDAFTSQGTIMMRESCKPANEWQTVNWMQPLSTTAGSHFVNYHNVQKAQPFKPKREPPPPTRFDTRSTQQDAFPSRSFAYVPPKPFYPKEQARQDVPFDHTSTSRAAYIPHKVQKYVPAKKPQPSMQFSD